MKGIQDVTVGEVVTHTVVVTEKKHNDFQALSGDDSPIHSDPAFARTNGFKDKLGYAFLLTAILSEIYGTIFPGGSELCLKQECHFPQPHYVGDELTFRVEAIHKNEDLHLLTVMTSAANQEKQVVFRGKATFQLSLGQVP